MSAGAMRTRLLASTGIRDDHAEINSSSLDREARNTDGGRRHATEESESDESGSHDSESKDAATKAGSLRYEDASQSFRGAARYLSSIYEAQLSPDGTCIFTTSYDRKFSVYPIDSDILETSSQKHLVPYAQYTASNPIWAFAVSPFYALNDVSSAQVLISTKNQYINLHNALYDMTPGSSRTTPGPLDISTKIASYKLIDNLTEEVIAPLSLTYTNDGTHFLAGSQHQISIFDLQHTYEPITKIRTIPSKRSNLKGGGVGYKGHVTSLAVSPSSSGADYGMLAAGTRTREVGLYDLEGFGQRITNFSLPGKRQYQHEYEPGYVGNGVSQLRWSPCGNYLYIAERNSDVLFIYDVRNYAIDLAHCTGRSASTPQKLGFDLWSAGEGQEIWAGGTDGRLRFWRNPHLKGGAIVPDGEVVAGEDPVASTLVHPCGNLAIAAFGKREVVDEGDDGPDGLYRSLPRHREWGRLDILSLESEED